MGCTYLRRLCSTRPMRTRVREAVSELAHGKQPFHWHDESPVRRRKAVKTVSVLDALHLVVIGMGMDSRRQERARRQCLTRMLWEMSAADVHQAWLDARTPSQNAKDIALVDILRVRGELADELRVDFGYPRGPSRCCGCPTLWPGRLASLGVTGTSST